MLVESECHWKAARIIRSLSGWVGRKLSPNNPSFPSSSSAPLTWDRSLRNSSICTETRKHFILEARAGHHVSSLYMLHGKTPKSKICIFTLCNLLMRKGVLKNTSVYFRDCTRQFIRKASLLLDLIVLSLFKIKCSKK